MSYPNQPNPYGPPQGQPQGPPQPQYGYPQQQPVQPYAPFPGGPAGMPGIPAPTVMPGGVKAARVMLYVMAGLTVIGLGVVVFLLSTISKASKSEYVSSSSFESLQVGKGLLIAMIIGMVLWGAAAIVAATQFSKGGNGARVMAIVVCVTGIVFSFVFMPFGLVYDVMCVISIVMVSKTDGAAWFTRPRY
ncbi:hypothetical protein ACH4FX_18235 [Streptomyces sp. NPDC018019]|uniref:hypothetical protein n=1 Tax=Streptomyces sp. NPDC018019 TaxID=3365030 RepID=UPI0037B36B09